MKKFKLCNFIIFVHAYTLKFNLGEQEIEQIISVLRTQLRIPKRENKRVTIGRATEIEVNHLPLNLEKLFQKTVYHMDVQFIPKLPGKLLR